MTQRIDRSGLRGALPVYQQQIMVVPARILMFSNVSDKHQYNKEEFKKMSSSFLIVIEGTIKKWLPLFVA